MLPQPPTTAVSSFAASLLGAGDGHVSAAAGAGAGGAGGAGGVVVLVVAVAGDVAVAAAPAGRAHAVAADVGDVVTTKKRQLGTHVLLQSHGLIASLQSGVVVDAVAVVARQRSIALLFPLLPVLLPPSHHYFLASGVAVPCALRCFVGKNDHLRPELLPLLSRHHHASLPHHAGLTVPDEHRSAGPSGLPVVAPIRGTVRSLSRLAVHARLVLPRARRSCLSCCLLLLVVLLLQLLSSINSEH